MPETGAIPDIKWSTPAGRSLMYFPRHIDPPFNAPSQSS